MLKVVVDFSPLNYSNINNRIVFLHYILYVEISTVFIKGDKYLNYSSDRKLSDFYRDSLKLLDFYLKFNSKKESNNLGLSDYSLCCFHTTIYGKNYFKFLDTYLSDSSLSLDFITQKILSVHSLLDVSV